MKRNPSGAGKPARAPAHHYLPIPEALFHCGFYVTGVGRSVVPPRSPYPPTSHPPLYHFNQREGRILPELSLVRIEAGAGTFESRATGAVRLKTGAAFLIFPGVWHRYAPEPASGWTETWMHFNGEFAHLLIQQDILHPARAILAPTRSRSLAAAMGRLRAAVERQPSRNSLLISLLGLGVLTAALGAPALPSPCGRAGPASPENQSDSLVVAAVEYIWTQSHHVLSVADVARAVGVTRRTLERHMAASQGRSVLAEIINCRFSRAERLLRETRIPIKAIVGLAGFGSVENMRQLFVGRTGLSPEAYRAKG